MAGSTGKMTREAIAARGPRMHLSRICRDGKWIGMVIYRYGQMPVRYGDATGMGLGCSVISKSYSLRYLLNVTTPLTPLQQEPNKKETK